MSRFAIKRAGGNTVYNPDSPLSVDWSPDSKWLAYIVNTQALVTTVFAYSVEQDTSFAITEGLSEVTEPMFDKSGKYLLHRFRRHPEPHPRAASRGR